MPQIPPGAGCRAPPISPVPALRISMNALRSKLVAIARRRSGLSKGGLSRLTIRLRLMTPGGTLQIACGTWLCASFRSGIGRVFGKVMSNFPGDKCQNRRRQVADDRVFDAIEVRPPRFPVSRISRYLDVFVRLEFDEFERAGADRMAAHIPRRHMARIDRREPGSEKCKKGGLRPLQMKGDLVITSCTDALEVAIPGFTGINAEFVVRLFEQ